MCRLITSNIILVLLLLISGSAYSGEIIATNGKWVTYKSHDSFEDKTSCISMYEGRPYITLTVNGVHKGMLILVKDKGVIKGGQMKYDNNEPIDVPLADKDKEHNVFYLPFFEKKFSRPRKMLFSSKQFRVRIVTSDEVINEEIGPVGIKETYDVLLSKDCK